MLSARCTYHSDHWKENPVYPHGHQLIKLLGSFTYNFIMFSNQDRISISAIKSYGSDETGWLSGKTSTKTFIPMSPSFMCNLPLCNSASDRESASPIPLPM